MKYLNKKEDRILTLYINKQNYINFVLCPSGEFVLENSLHNITDRSSLIVSFSKSFRFSETPITHKQWRDIVGEDYSYSSDNKIDNLPISELDYPSIKRFLKEINEKFKREGVIGDSDKIDLPNIAQWEYACRSGSTTKWFFGNDDTDLEKYAWFNENSQGRKHSIKTRLPNAWGIYDVYGNVLEPCYGLIVPQPFPVRSKLIDVESDYSNPPELRGGSFESIKECCLPDYTHLNNLMENHIFRDPVGLRLVLYQDIPYL